MKFHGNSILIYVNILNQNKTPLRGKIVMVFIRIMLTKE